jgi:hypothetical protein
LRQIIAEPLDDLVLDERFGLPSSRHEDRQRSVCRAMGRLESSPLNDEWLDVIQRDKH